MEDLYVDGKLVRMARRPQDGTEFLSPEQCPSTHGGSGYAPGSFVLGDDIVCAICGAVIEHKGRKPDYIIGAE